MVFPGVEQCGVRCGASVCVAALLSALLRRYQRWVVYAAQASLREWAERFQHIELIFKRPKKKNLVRERTIVFF